MGHELLKVENLYVQYKTYDNEIVKAVNGISFSLNPGETLGLVGETGAGKTTTALSLMRLLPKDVGKITRGNIWYKGKSVVEMTKRQVLDMRGKQISMIFQDPLTSLNPSVTVGDQIAEAVELHETLNKHEVQAKVEELFELVGIPKERLKEYPHQFSGGMKQRVVIAMSLACNPEVLIADEPTTALDVTIQAQVLMMMNNLKEKYNTAMILITHDLGVVAEICDKVAIMYAGEIVEAGSIEEIFEHPQHPYTVGLMGSIPGLDEKKHRLTPIPGLMPDPTDLPQGCKFHPRCPYATQRCKEANPDVFEFEGHQVKCWRAEIG